MKLFGVGASDHPMAEVKAARAILDAIPAGDPSMGWKTEITGWKSVRTCGFNPSTARRSCKMVDDARRRFTSKLQREYLSSQRLSKFRRTGCGR